MNNRCEWRAVSLAMAGVLGAALWVGIGCAHAAEDGAAIVTDRPDFTESPQTVPQGKIQIESGATFTRGGDEKAQSLGEVLVRVPLGPRSELRIGVPNYLRLRGGGATDSGFDDLYLGGKWVLREGFGRRPQIALLAGSTLPTGSRRMAERAYQPEAVVAAAMDLTDKIALSTNVGFACARSDGERFSQVFASLSLGYSFSEKWGSYVEAYGFNRVEPGGSSQQYFNSGLTYLINDDFQLDARVGLGLQGGAQSRERFVGFGAARRF